VRFDIEYKVLVAHHGVLIIARMFPIARTAGIWAVVTRHKGDGTSQRLEFVVAQLQRCSSLAMQELTASSPATSHTKTNSNPILVLNIRVSFASVEADASP
jgi:hypothetical protein